MAKLCTVQLMGNLGGDPEMRYTPDGKAVTQFSVAVNQSTKDKVTGEWNDATDWFRCSVFGNFAESVAERFRKGNQVYVAGRFKTRTYVDNQGASRTSLDLIADTVVLAERRERDGSEAPVGANLHGTFTGTTATPPMGPGSDADLDDLPF